MAIVRKYFEDFESKNEGKLVDIIMFYFQY